MKVKAKGLLYNNEYFSITKLSKTTGINAYGIKKLLDHFGCSEGDDVTEIVTKSNWLLISSNKRGSTYRINNQSLTRKEISKLTGLSLPYVQRLITKHNIPIGKDVSFVFDQYLSKNTVKKEDKALISSLVKAGYIFCGNKVNIAKISQSTGLSMASVRSRISSHYPINYRMDRFINKTKSALDVTSLFVWQSDSNPKSVGWAGIKKNNKATYLVDGKAMEISAAATLLNSSISTTYKHIYDYRIA